MIGPVSCWASIRRFVTKKDKRGSKPGPRFPRLTCNECGETKVATRFPKRGGYRYRDVLTTDPRKYAKTCKRCMKPLKPGQKREDIPEPVLRTYSRAMRKLPASKAKQARLKRERRRKYKNKPLDDKAKARVAQQRIARRAATRIHSMQYLAAHGCEECNERDPRKLEYDHKDPDDKSVNVSRLILNGHSWRSPVLRAEIAKCRILCANCHRKHTIEQQGFLAEDEIREALSDLATEYGFTM